MKLNTTKIRNGDHIGEVVWVCSYHQPDLNKKPLRSQKPTKCKVVSIEQIPTNTVYYSTTYFAPIGKSGNITQKIISPVDNTGYRSDFGNEIDVFDNEQECIEHWNKQLEEVAKRADTMASKARAMWLIKVKELLDKRQ